MSRHRKRTRIPKAELEKELRRTFGGYLGRGRLPW